MVDAPRVTPEDLAEADHRLVRTVDTVSDDQLREPSLLPGWTRAHVIAHLALNAEALQGVLTGQRQGQPQPMYAAPDARDADIEELAAAPGDELRSRLMAATHDFDAAVRAMSDEDHAARFERTPGGPTFPVGAIPLMRLREVEIHHADLALDYSAADWSTDFCVLVIDSMTRRDHPAPFRVLARDLARTWQLGPGEGGPLLAGDSHDLAWWLTGRGEGHGVESDSGTLVEVPAW